MYTSHNLAKSIKHRAKQQKIAIKDMLVNCELGSNTMSSLYHGKSIAFDSLAIIADYLDCSVDYLLGRTDVPEVNHRKSNILSVPVHDDETVSLVAERRQSAHPRYDEPEEDDDDQLHHT